MIVWKGQRAFEYLNYKAAEFNRFRDQIFEYLHFSLLFLFCFSESQSFSQLNLLKINKMPQIDVKW